jgi:hypothetical protein
MYDLPIIVNAPLGHTSAHLPQAWHFSKSTLCAPFGSMKCAPLLQTLTHSKQFVHFDWLNDNCGLYDLLSGL